MASISNLMVTPPANGERKNFIDIFECNSPDCRHTKDLNSELTPRWYLSLRKFHRDRVLEFSCLNSDIPKTKETLCEKFSIDIKHVEIPPKPNTVYVVPSRPEVLDPLVQDWTPPLDVKCRFSSSESYLCLSNLPQETDNDEDFLKLVAKFGPVDNAFLVYHHRTDKSLGFGLVEYCSREVAFQARNLLHQNRGIFCDWLDHRLVTYSCLYPKCLVARTSCLNEEQLRKHLSVISLPIYCQVIPGTDTVLVEYLNADDAMLSLNNLMSISEDEMLVHDVYLANPGKNALKLHEKMLADNQVSIKPDNTTSLMPFLPFTQLPISMLGHHLRLLGSLFPAPLAAPPTRSPTLTLIGASKNDIQPMNPCISPCVINAFGFDLPCSPIVQCEKNKMHIRSASIQGPTNAFGFPLPCSPLHRILGHENKPSSPSSMNMDKKTTLLSSSLQLNTPPSWKNFRLRTLTLTPDQTTQQDSNSDLTRSVSRILESFILETPPQSRSLWSPLKQVTTESLTPVRASQGHAKRLGKRLKDSHADSENCDREMEKVGNGSTSKKRLVLSQLDNVMNTAWHLDSTWKKWDGSKNVEDSLQEKKFPSQQSENSK